METIDKKVTNELAALRSKFADDEKVKEFEKSLANFEELVKKGYAKKRGNHLISVSDSHIKSQTSYNV